MSENKILTSALWYLKEGFSVIPLNNDKKPYIEWTKYQTEQPTEHDIKLWWQKWDKAMIGLVTGERSGISVIDFDSHKMNDQQYLDTAKDFPQFEIFETPTALSAKGGKHLYFKYCKDLPQSQNRYPNVDIRNDGGYIVAPPSISSTGKYQWVQNKKIKIVPYAELPQQWLETFKQYIYSNNTNILYKGSDLGTSQEITGVTNSHKYYIQGKRDDDLFHAGLCLIKGGADIGFTKQTLELIANNLGEEFGPKVVNEKINSILKRVENQNRNITEEVKQWVESQEGHFKVTDYYTESQVVTKAHKHAAVMAIKRLCEGDNPILEKYGEQRGVYRRIDSKVEEITWWDTEADNALKDVRWFFGLEQLINTMPKNIYLIAGDQDAGKSALCLNMAIMNCRKYNIHYFSSEMAGEELGSRLHLYDRFDLELFRTKIKFKDRSKNFADVIQPNDINIIDFLEITDNFYTIAKDLTEIRNKLNKGIAIIAIQKKRGVDLGRGAEFSLEKPRLYLSVGAYFPKNSKFPDGNVVKIIKAKNWANPEINPNGKFYRFKLYKGINLLPGGIWEEEIA